ncbi:MAG TPA: hypothetical protein VFQ23_21595 [Anaerolineales bacterium]|nr:hypothetical protein [Anaerolineales bacterium]
MGTLVTLHVIAKAMIVRPKQSSVIRELLRRLGLDMPFATNVQGYSTSGSSQHLHLAHTAPVGRCRGVQV